MLTSEHWKKWHRNDALETIPENWFLMDLVKKYLPAEGECIELGCTPGRFLAALAKNFRYKLSGIDIVDLEKTRTLLEYNGIRDVTLIQDDMFAHVPKNPYDVVFSYGLIEHWEDPRVPFKQFDKFCRSGGYMFMGLPNFRYLFWFAHKLLGSGLFHNYDIMDLRKIRELTSGYRTIYLGYYPRLYKFNFLLKSRLTAPSIIFIGQKL